MPTPVTLYRDTTGKLHERMKKMTETRARALDWIPKDGSWRTKAGRITAALNALSINCPGTVECEWADCGPRGGRLLRWRLTPLGVRTFAHLAAQPAQDSGGKDG